MANGDSQLLLIALQNLLNNAWKYTGKQPNTKIEFGAMPLETVGSRQGGEGSRQSAVGSRQQAATGGE